MLKKVFIGGGALAAGMVAWMALSPAPGAWIIDQVFERGGEASIKALAKHAPAETQVVRNVNYDPGGEYGADTLLDVHLPARFDRDSGRKLPVVFWIHGGGWLSGSKDDYATYYDIVAEKGFAVVAPNYTLAPHAVYPTQVAQLATALSFIQAQADELNLDTDRIVLAGDSAGAQLASQIGAMVTNPVFAGHVGIEPAITPGQLRGLVLDCGVYDMESLVASGRHGGIIGWGINAASWAYTGSRDHEPTNIGIRQMTTIKHVTADYPPVYMSAGNADPLTDSQSRPFARHLEALGVDLTSRIYPADHTAQLPHEFQFDLDTPEGQQVLTDTIRFLRARLKD